MAHIYTNINNNDDEAASLAWAVIFDDLTPKILILTLVNFDSSRIYLSTFMNSVT